MAIGARVPASPPGGTLHPPSSRFSDEVELYHRTYTTLLRSSGETLLRVLEPAHRTMQSSLHALAASEELDLGAFIYATRRLPDPVWQARLIVMGQEAEAFERAGLGLADDWPALEAPARRRHWYDVGDGRLAVLLASTSDLDDVIPTLVAYQIEWNKLRSRLRAAGEVPSSAAEAAEVLGGTLEDWERLDAAWGFETGTRLLEVAERRLNLRIQLLGGSEVGYARMTRRWWQPVNQELGGSERPVYFVSSNTHALVNLLTGFPRAHEEEIVDWIRDCGPPELNDELKAFEDGRTEGSWENFLYYAARGWLEGADDDELGRRRGEFERAVGVRHMPSRTALRVSAQVFELSRLDPGGLDPRLDDVDADRLAASDAVIVNIEYPLGLAAYNILREVAVSRRGLRGVYVLGKAATLNADVGDVMLSSVVHDEHSSNTYWLDNAFTVQDIQPWLVFGSGLDNQRAVTVKSTFLQNREYLDFYYREAFTVVEMEAGPFANAVYEIAEAERHPMGESVNFSKLPIDFGIIHYASDTPYTQARTLGARGLDYYGMDSTYASSIAIARRILTLERVLA
jgi:hypothetical protein